MATMIKRSDALRVSVSSDVKQRLNRVAEALGMSPGTVCTYAIGIFLAQTERNLSMQETVVKAMAEKVGGDIGEQLKLFMKEGKE